MSVRQLVAVSADPAALVPAVRAAVFGDGPAILPVDPARLADARRDPTIPAEVDARAAVVIQTSGSTGRPKRVLLGADALLASARATRAALGSGRWLLALPGHYVAGLQVIVRALDAGDQPVTMPGGRYTVEGFRAALGGMAQGPRFAALVPKQLADLLDAAEAGGWVGELAALDAVLIGGQAVPESMRARAARAGVRVVATYGATETSGGCVYDGVPLAGVSLRLRDGRLELSGPSLALGYLDPAATAEAFVEDSTGRWYRTSDRARLRGGRLEVLGRVDQVIVSGGLKLDLAEVEAWLRARPDCSADAVAVPVDDPTWGQGYAVATGRGGGEALAAVAVSVAEADAGPEAGVDAGPDAVELDVAALADELAERFGVQGRPRLVLALDELPRLTGGKPDRRALAAEAARRLEAGGAGAEDDGAEDGDSGSASSGGAGSAGGDTIAG